jgi:hypothetical protein
MAAPEKPPCRPFWSRCRRSFRWCRIAALGVVLFVLLGLTWLRVAGLPDFIRTRIVDELGQRGVTANFSSLRFHWFRGLVASDLRVAWGGTNGPRLAIAEADLDISPPPWHERREVVRGLRIRSGSLALPIPVDDEPPLELQVDRVAADIRFLPGDAWEVRQLGAQVLGLELDLRATVTNVTAFQRKRTTPDPAAAAQRRRVLRSVLEQIRLCTFGAPPRLEVTLQLDGLQPNAASGTAYLEIPEARTPQGDLRGLRVSLRDTLASAPAAAPALAPPPPHHSVVTVELAGVQTSHGGADGISAQLDFRGPARPELATNATWRVTAEHVFMRNFRARALSVTGTNLLLAAPTGVTRADLESLPIHTLLVARAREIETLPNLGNPVTGVDLMTHLDVLHTLLPRLGSPRTNNPPAAPTPLSLHLEASLASLSGTPGTSGPVRLQVHLGTPEGEPRPAAPANVAAWSHLWPFLGSLDIALEQVQSPKLAVEKLELGIDWKAPIATVRRLESSLYRGNASVQGSLDVATRLAQLKAKTTFDFHGIDELLGPKSRENFVRYQWQDPPRFEGSASVTLPPWGEAKPDWKGTVKNSARLDGRFETGPGGFKGVPFDSARSSITFDGSDLLLPDLNTTRPEGSQAIRVVYNPDTREYQVDARGRVLPQVLRPIIGEKSAVILDLFEFKSPVDAVVSVWGPWTEGDKQSILGTVVATNLGFRGHRFDRLEASVVYTNRTLVGAPVRITRDQGELVSPGVRYEFDTDLLSITNTLNSIDPTVIAAVISPGFEKKLEHYRFDNPPTVRAQGTLQPRRIGSARMAFDIEGGPFHFWRFSADRINTRLLWEQNNLTFTNIQAGFYRGTLQGQAVFDLTDPEDGRYQFKARVRDGRLEDLLKEVTQNHTNLAQGTFDLDLDIDSARTTDIRTWNGSGSANLRDGLIWDAPLFGFMSPVLNAIIPGIGNNRAKRADATFVVSNGVFHTRDLVIACPPATLLYRGTIDLDQRINARVEAQVLGEIAGFGPLFGLVLKPLTKLLEYRVTGTLSRFDAEPLYALPKVILFPLQPLRFFRGMFSPAPSKSDLPTNPPPITLPPLPPPQ